MGTNTPVTVTDSMGVVVTAAMESAGKTVLGLSEETGIPRMTLTRRLNTGNFRMSELDAVAHALGTTPADLTHLASADQVAS